MAGREPASLITARDMLWGYANGIFPMAVSASDPTLHWFDPPERGVLPVGDVHVSRSMRRYLRRSEWSASLNRDFSGVLHNCAARKETWINAPLISLYEELHSTGHAHSLEISCGNKLAGGLFGVTIGGAFFGESMFSVQPNGSKAALIWMSAHMKNCGFTLFDTQYRTAHLASMGGRVITREEYIQHLLYAIELDVDITSHPLPESQALWQPSTQTS